MCKLVFRLPFLSPDFGITVVVFLVFQATSDCTGQEGEAADILVGTDSGHSVLAINQSRLNVYFTLNGLIIYKMKMMMR